jgi:hypothetical protein
MANDAKPVGDLLRLVFLLASTQIGGDGAPVELFCVSASKSMFYTSEVFSSIDGRSNAVRIFRLSPSSDSVRSSKAQFPNIALMPIRPGHLKFHEAGPMQIHVALATIHTWLRQIAPSIHRPISPASSWEMDRHLSYSQGWLGRQ